MQFVWLTEGITFREPREVLRFLYLHEWMHWWLRERRGQRSRAETACDRFALLNFRKAVVTVDDRVRFRGNVNAVLLERLLRAKCAQASQH